MNYDGYYQKICGMKTLSLIEKTARKRVCAALYYRANKAKVIASVKQWAVNNPGKKRVINRRWATAHPDQVKALSRKSSAAWRAANIELAKAACRRSARAWQRAYPAKRLENNRNWQRENPVKLRANRAERRARELGAVIALTKRERTQVLGAYVIARMLTKIRGEPYHVDHVIPLAKGGLHHPVNLQVLRGAENLRKGCR